jgi:hypothetical protein
VNSADRSYGSVNATRESPSGPASRIPWPPAEITRYCLPFGPRNVMGVARALVGSAPLQGFLRDLLLPYWQFRGHENTPVRRSCCPAWPPTMPSNRRQPPNAFTFLAAASSSFRKYPGAAEAGSARVRSSEACPAAAALAFLPAFPADLPPVPKPRRSGC